MVPSQARPLATQQNPNDWQVMGETFEVMGKIGLAMTVGFTVAAAFCKLASSGNVKVPQASTWVQLLTTQEAPLRDKNA